MGLFLADAGLAGDFLALAAGLWWARGETPIRRLESRQFHRVCKATRARGRCDRRGGLRRLSFEMCGARGHAYVMDYAATVLGGTLLLAAALALVGFFGLFFAMAHVRLVIPLAIIAKMLRARVTALPKSRAALLFISFTFIFKRVFNQPQIAVIWPKQSAHTSVRHGTGKEAVLIVCHNSTSKQTRALFCTCGV